MICFAFSVNVYSEVHSKPELKKQKMKEMVHIEGLLTRNMPLMTRGLRESASGCKVEDEREVLPGRKPDDLLLPEG